VLSLPYLPEDESEILKTRGKFGIGEGFSWVCGDECICLLFTFSVVIKIYGQISVNLRTILNISYLYLRNSYKFRSSSEKHSRPENRYGTVPVLGGNDV